MWLDDLFTALSTLAAAGWAVLLLGRRWPRSQRVKCALAIPALLARHQLCSDRNPQFAHALAELAAQ